MDFLELARERYSVRRFTDQPIEDDKLARILEAARLAPTGKNNQPWRLYVIKSPEMRERLKDVSPCTWDAPVVFALTYNRDEMWTSDDGLRSSGAIDCTIVGDHMIMEAWEIGIGSCWVLLFDPDKLRELLELPDNIEPCVLIPMGYADKGPAHLHDKSRDLSELVFEV